MLASGDEIGETSIAADFETVTERAIEFLGAVGAEDVGTLVSTGAAAVGGRGEELNRLLASLTTVVSDLDGQRLEIARTIDGFAQLSRDLARGDDPGRDPDRRPLGRLGDPGPQPGAHHRRPPRHPGHDPGDQPGPPHRPHGLPGQHHPGPGPDPVDPGRPAPADRGDADLRQRLPDRHQRQPHRRRAPPRARPSTSGPGASPPRRGTSATVEPPRLRRPAGRARARPLHRQRHGLPGPQHPARAAGRPGCPPAGPALPAPDGPGPGHRPAHRVRAATGRRQRRGAARAPSRSRPGSSTTRSEASADEAPHPGQPRLLRRHRRAPRHLGGQRRPPDGPGRPAVRDHRRLRGLSRAPARLRRRLPGHADRPHRRRRPGRGPRRGDPGHRRRSGDPRGLLLRGSAQVRRRRALRRHHPARGRRARRPGHGRGRPRPGRAHDHARCRTPSSSPP